MAAALVGVDGVPVEVEVRISSHLPRVDIVGLPEAAVRESAARVRAAVTSIGRRFPDRRITVNLAPAGLRKSGAGLDLAIAVGILSADGAFEPARVAGVGFLGELALDGRLRPVRGILAQVMALHDAGCREVVVPAACAAEAALAPGVEARGAADLAAVLAFLVAGHPLPRAAPLAPGPGPDTGPDLRSVRGQEGAKRALEIAAAGGHALLLRGPPGAGKTLLARTLPGILPGLDFDEALEVTRVHGASGLLDPAAPFARARPFRAPHHTASRAGLLGGGSPPRPGEVSLAHRGVLFLDELPEFERRCLESLRQVMEERRVAVARASGSVVFPAAFQLVAAANPCPCGWYRSGARDCRCDEAAVARYEARLSGPLLDRFDLSVRVAPVPFRALDGPPAGEPSPLVRARVEAARAVQAHRLRGADRPGPAAARGAGPERASLANVDIPVDALDALVRATPDARALLARSAERRALSARAVHRALRVARTVADLAGDEKVGPAAMAEALAFRHEEVGPA